MNGDDVSVLDVVLILFIAMVAIGAIWAISVTVGPFLPPQAWLLIVGGIGIFGVYVFVKSRR